MMDVMMAVDMCVPLRWIDDNWDNGIPEIGHELEGNHPLWFQTRIFSGVCFQDGSYPPQQLHMGQWIVVERQRSCHF